MILIYSEEITPRLIYTTNLIFTQILQIEPVLTKNKSEFQESDLPKINYSHNKFGNEIFINPHPLLFGKELFQQNTETVLFEGERYFFESGTGSLFPFDPLAASFYLVTRYEEYFEIERDAFGRFSVEQSILFKNGLLKKPVVNLWANLLAKEIVKNYPGFIFSKKKFHFISTIDIDNAWAFKNKGFWRKGGAAIKCILTGNFSEFKARLKVWSGKKKDPYDTYDYLDSVFSGNEEKVKFFFLLGEYGPLDKNVSHENKDYQNLIRKIQLKYDIGIHPSDAGFKHGCHGKVIRENGRLKKIAGKECFKSRQHYLNLDFPKTYQNLIKAGIVEDYTMGYASQPGFRAGICTPFYFYDLTQEMATTLLIVPFQVMDGTLLHYLALSPEKAFEEIKTIMNAVKDVNGTFVSIWHNETVNDLGEWKGFRAVFEKMNQLGFQWANE